MFAYTIYVYIFYTYIKHTIYSLLIYYVCCINKDYIDNKEFVDKTCIVYTVYCIKKIKYFIIRLINSSFNVITRALF